MKRFTVINKYINKYDYKTYLEIGTRKNTTFNHISIDKTSVDPDPIAEADYQMTSDEFFAKIYSDKKFDIVFCDGLHESPQLYKDIINSLRHLSDNGTIICHDCNPIDEKSTLVPRMQKHWNGDVYKDIVRLRTEIDSLDIFTIDTDEGCTVIRKGKSVQLNIMDDINYKNLEKNRKEWLNLLSLEEWLKKLENG